MVQIKKESVFKTYREHDVLVETIKQFHYSSEKEKMEHKKIMEQLCFKDSGQVQENIGTIMCPKYVWFGSYYKHEIIENDYN